MASALHRFYSVGAAEASRLLHAAKAANDKNGEVLRAKEMWERCVERGGPNPALTRWLSGPGNCAARKSRLAGRLCGRCPACRLGARTPSPI
jgi:hypothetical protein